MKILRKLILGIIVLAVMVASTAYMKLNREVEKSLNLKMETSFTIPSGQGFQKTAMQLQKQGIVENAQWVYWYSRLNNLSHKIKAGEYAIPSNITTVKLVDLFISGKVKRYSFTIIEGWSFKDLLRNIRKDESLIDDVANLTNSQIMSLMQSENVHPEGQFLPETYSYTKGTKVSSVLKRAHKDLKLMLNNMWNKRQRPTPLNNSYEALILASIVEKETGVKHERPKIAGVFINRLNLKMKLQTDPTVIYGMGDSYKGDIRFKDLRNYTPYNTYKIKGLPPTPIAMAGRAALEAVVWPEKTDALFFVATGNGEHKFSVTLKEHNNAVNKYQRKRNPL